MDRRTAAGSDKIQFSLSALTLERRVTTNVCAAMVNEAPVYLNTQTSKSSVISVYVPEGRETRAIMTRAIPDKRSRRLCRVRAALTLRTDWSHPQ
jgi:hypothetical protein